jgi:hypothetical protein
VSERKPLYIVGDIHGQYEKLTGLLRRAGLIDEQLAWAGGTARLWLLGDFFDRGPGAIAAIDLVIRLQAEAAAAGGAVQSLIGNHEPLIMAALRFGDQPTGWGGTFLGDWFRNGGDLATLAQLTPARVAWLAGLPAMALVDDRLLIHADSTMYSSYGDTIEQVNQAFGALLSSDNPAAWDRLLGQFSERLAFADSDPDGAARARRMLADFGGRQIIHGHTPISYVSRRAPASIAEPLIYAGGLCVNVDGGMYQGGPGFVYRAEPSSPWE